MLLSTVCDTVSVTKLRFRVGWKLAKHGTFADSALIKLVNITLQPFIVFVCKQFYGLQFTVDSFTVYSSQFYSLQFTVLQFTLRNQHGPKTAPR